MVAQGRFIPNHEKVNILRRVLAGLAATGVDRVVMMPDSAMLCRAALEGGPPGLKGDILDLVFFNEEEDSTKAARAMAEMGVGSLVTLGGDGTNRAVAKGSGNVPLVPISTGTNNVFPVMVEGTVAGLAAGVVARGLVDIGSVVSTGKLWEVYLNGVLDDIALVDVAVSKERFVGARAIWDLATLDELFVARSGPACIGLSAIGYRLLPTMGDKEGVHVRLGGGITVNAPIAPGVMSQVPVKDWRSLKVGDGVDIEHRACTLALDGERSIALTQSNSVRVVLSDKGPPVVSVDAAIREAALAGVFTDGASAQNLNSD
jgi:predicted polyphosphate/ATP-dependent NAD kinase